MTAGHCGGGFNHQVDVYNNGVLERLLISHKAFHPRFDLTSSPYYSVDLAYFRLSKNVSGPFGSVIGVNDSLVEGKRLSVLGYGGNYNSTSGTFTVGLKSIGNLILGSFVDALFPHQESIKYSKIKQPKGLLYNIPYDSRNQYTCPGDSGGPATAILGSSEKIVGVMSFGSYLDDTDAKSACRTVNSNFHVNLQPFSAWVQSSEIIARPPSNSRFVDLLYVALMYRIPSASERDFWVGRLNSTSRKNVALGFLTSRERREKIVTEMYAQYLDRLPDQNGLDFWVGEIIKGKRYSDVVLGFIGSDEYYDRAQSEFSEGSPNRRFVRKVYRDLLGRDGDQPGIDFWEGKLNTGTPRMNVCSSMIYSDERLFGIADLYARMAYFRNTGASDGDRSYVVDQIKNKRIHEENVQADFFGSTDFYQQQF